MADALSLEKRALRAELRERRQNMSAPQRESAAIGFTNRLQELVSRLDATSLSCYLPLPSEPDTRKFIDWAKTNGVRTLFPVTREDGLLDWTVGNDAVAETIGLFGVPEPSGALLDPMALNDVELILVPAAAVDRTGMRLGWGRGYFDKTLGSMQRCPPVYAVIFDSELVERVPRERHDQPVNGVVTPTRIVDFA